MSELKSRQIFSNIQIVILLSILVSISIIFRIVVFPFELPIYQDGEVYFWYANDMSILNDFPGWGKDRFPNTLWPTLLSGFFSIVDSNNFIDYMTLQRIVTVGISIVTVIPIFFLCKKFVDPLYAVIGSSLFLFDPRLIQSSLNGLTEPLFLLLGIISILLFLSKRMICIFISFGILALFALTRYEGLVLIIPFSIMFFWRYRSRKYLIRYLICITIFLTIIFSVDFLKNETIDNSTFVYLFAGSTNIAKGNVELQNGCDIGDETTNCISKNTKTFFGIFYSTISNIIKYYGWMLVPLFLVFIPIGLFKFLKNRNFEKWTIIICMIFMLLPAFYAFSRDFQEMRYLYIQIPLLCVIASLSIKFFSEKINREKIVITLFLSCIILTGGIFYYDQVYVDNKQEKEYFEIAKKINSTMKVTNEIFPADKYIRSAKIAELSEFPVLRNSFELFSLKVISIDETCNNIEHSLCFKNKISIDEKETLREFLEFAKENDLGHLVIDDDGDDVKFLYDIFHNENNFKFLEKIYDSTNYGFEYHVKFYKIDYEIVEEYYGYEL
jgi:hypothetical protein